VVAHDLANPTIADDPNLSASDRSVVDKVSRASATTGDHQIVAFVRSGTLFVNDDEVATIRAISDATVAKLVKQCGSHIRIVNIKPNELVYRPSAHRLPTILQGLPDSVPPAR
jgi:hypothetical protein